MNEKYSTPTRGRPPRGLTLFHPLRRRIQTIVNRRFFRADYDATQTLSAFGESVRDQVDLSSMQDALLSIVQEAIHPTHLSLWLKTEPNRTMSGLTEGR